MLKIFFYISLGKYIEKLNLVKKRPFYMDYTTKKNKLQVRTTRKKQLDNII